MIPCLVYFEHPAGFLGPIDAYRSVIVRATAVPSYFITHRRIRQNPTFHINAQDVGDRQPFVRECVQHPVQGIFQPLPAHPRLSDTLGKDGEEFARHIRETYGQLMHRRGDMCRRCRRPGKYGDLLTPTLGECERERFLRRRPERAHQGLGVDSLHFVHDSQFVGFVRTAGSCAASC